MRIAIMQPYFFPYHGYFELIQKSDLFIFYTDVQYIQRGWVNRNRIRSPDGWRHLTVPVKHAPLQTLIHEIKTEENWLSKHLRTLEVVYGQTRCRAHPVFTMFKQTAEETVPDLCSLLMRSVERTSRLLGLKTPFADSRSLGATGKHQDRVIDICKKVGATTCVCPSGSNTLYNLDDFAKQGITLEIMGCTTYQNKLSILDVMLGGGLNAIVYASRHGHSARVAKDIGWHHVFNAKDNPDLKCFDIILFVCPTYGDGELPPAMENYLLTLNGRKKYAICELGHYHGYENLQFGAATIIERHLDALGWQKFAPTLSLDAQPHIDWDNLRPWKEELEQCLSTA